MKVYLINIRGSKMENQVVVCEKVEDIIDISFNGDRENFLEYALITNLSNMKNPLIAFEMTKDGIIETDEILIERLKANGMEKISDYAKENIKGIYFNLNYGLNPNEQYLNYPKEHQEEIKIIIDTFRGYAL